MPKYSKNNRLSNVVFGSFELTSPYDSDAISRRRENNNGWMPFAASSRCSALITLTPLD